jgi:hypothetical protein
MKWGISHESDAIQDYLNVVNNIHNNFVYRQSGLVISTECPYPGASPDGCVVLVLVYNIVHVVLTLADMFHELICFVDKLRNLLSYMGECY